MRLCGACSVAGHQDNGYPIVGGNTRVDSQLTLGVTVDTEVVHGTAGYGVIQDAPTQFWKAVQELMDAMPGYIDDLEGLITTNEIVLARTRGVGILSPELAIDASVTGPILRASGVQWDLRRANAYEVYDRLDFEIPIGGTGDTFDRYLVRILEMRESVKIVRQCIDQIPEGPVKTSTPFFIRPPIGWDSTDEPTPGPLSLHARLPKGHGQPA